jgi:hypothetical protein
MSGNSDSLVGQATAGGLSATHPETEARDSIPVAPAFTNELNTYQLTLIPKACWKVEDMRFAFDSSFVLPEMKEELALLANLISEHSEEREGVKMKPPLSVFGHADPVGKDDYNKTLSGRRAIAIYAALIRKTEMWEKLYSQPFGGDNWGSLAVNTMLSHLGYRSGTPTTNAKEFQKANGLKDDGIVGPKTREKLFLAYMDSLCGENLKLTPEDFLARGADPKGRGDYQGCSEFNPLLIFSQEEEQKFSRPENKNERNRENAPNRRVMIFLFRPGRKVNPARWPCPAAQEGPDGCRKRFWSDSSARLANGPARREFKNTRDTFACRFYHRFAVNSPCERPLPPPKGYAFLSVIVFFHQQPIADLTVEFFQSGADGKPGAAVGEKVKTDEDGVAKLLKPVPIGNYVCQIQYQPATIVCTVPDIEEPFILVLPIGRPYYDFENDFEFTGKKQP